MLTGYSKIQVHLLTSASPLWLDDASAECSDTSVSVSAPSDREFVSAA